MGRIPRETFLFKNGYKNVHKTKNLTRKTEDVKHIDAKAEDVRHSLSPGALEQFDLRVRERVCARRATRGAPPAVRGREPRAAGGEGVDLRSEVNNFE